MYEYSTVLRYAVKHLIFLLLYLWTRCYCFHFLLVYIVEIFWLRSLLHCTDLLPYILRKVHLMLLRA
jgi:hypothetical protein